MQTAFLSKLFYSRRLEGGVHNTCKNSQGVGGYFCVKKMEILEGAGRKEARKGF